MKKILIALMFTTATLSHAGLFTTDVGLSSQLKIANGKQITLDRAGDKKLVQSIIDVEFDYKPTLGSGTLKINQGPTKIKIKIPKDRYHNEGEFTLYSVDSGLDYDIFVRRSAKNLISSREDKEMASCQFTKIIGVDQNGNVIQKLSPGTQLVLNRYNTFNRSYTLSFVRDNKTEASISQITESKETIRLESLSTCLPTDYNAIIN